MTHPPDAPRRWVVTAVVVLMTTTAVVILGDALCRLTTDRGCDWPWRDDG